MTLLRRFRFILLSGILILVLGGVVGGVFIHSLHAHAAGTPIGQTIWLKATNNSNYVSARTDQTNTPLDAMAGQVQAWEEFTVVDAGNGLIALKALANNNYVSARTDQTNSPLQAVASKVQGWEQFNWLPQSNNTIALQSAANNNYVSARTDQTNTPLNASASKVQGWEQFTWGPVSGTPSTSTPTGTSTGGQKITGVYITWYGFNDNSCQVESEHNCNTIAFPHSDGYATKHDIATEGTGTYADPITFATAAKDSGSPAEFAPGTIIYVPYVHKYFVMEDSCYECGQEWFTSSPHYHVDLWMGPSYGSENDPLMNCEDSLTLGSTNNGSGVIIVNPPTNLTVDTNPLFTNNTCTAHTYSNS
jgi:hypothetical protein